MLGLLVGLRLFEIKCFQCGAHKSNAEIQNGWWTRPPPFVELMRLPNLHLSLVFLSLTPALGLSAPFWLIMGEMKPLLRWVAMGPHATSLPLSAEWTFIVVLIAQHTPCLKNPLGCFLPRGQGHT